MKDPYSSLSFLDPRKEMMSSVVQTVRTSIRADLSIGPSRAKRPEKKTELERRQAAFFAYARGIFASDAGIEFGMVPEQDDSADAIIRTKANSGKFSYERVQLKEIVPAEVNEHQSLLALLQDITRRYCSGEHLTIAINLNREVVTTLGTVPDPGLKSVSFWLFGLSGPNLGFLVKDPFRDFMILEFQLPRLSSLTQLQ